MLKQKNLNKKLFAATTIGVIIVFLIYGYIASAVTTVDSNGISTSGLTVSGNMSVAGEETVNNLTVTGKIGTAQSTFNLLTTNAATVNFANAATALNIGSASGTTTINNNLAVSGGTTTLGTTTLNGRLNFTDNNSTITSNAGDFFVINTTENANLMMLQDYSGLGGLLYTGGINLSGFSGTARLDSPLLSTLEIFNYSAYDTVNFVGASTNISIGSSSGTTTINHNLAVSGGTIITGTATLQGDMVWNKTSPTILINSGETLTIRDRIDNSVVWSLSENGTTWQAGASSIGSTLIVNSGSIQSGGATTLNIATNPNEVTSLNLVTYATAISIGSTTGTTTINNNLVPSQFTVPSGTDLPATCGTGQLFQDTNDNACTDTNDGDGALCICKSADSWAVVSNF